MTARHSWSDPYREQFATKRRCWTCGLMRVTRHEPGVRPWTEFWRDGQRIGIVVARTPPCAGAPDAAVAAARHRCTA